ncbi:MAG: hypothetical protein HY296_06155 [Thaumarchaeota archaeon]|nr:hypothetical protein [Nitrososphaerota archaeon]
MQKYNVDSVNLELSGLEAVLAERLTNSLETDDLLDVAKGLIALDKEVYKVEEDARKLRLTGQLDIQVYTALSGGYRRLSDRLTKLAQQDEHAREISTLYRALRFTNEAVSLSDYLRELAR